jgi:hypothetical protein
VMSITAKAIETTARSRVFLQYGHAQAAPGEVRRGSNSANPGADNHHRGRFHIFLPYLVGKA